MKNSIKNEIKQHSDHEIPTMVGAAIRGIFAVIGAMALIALAIWFTTR